MTERIGDGRSISFANELFELDLFKIKASNARGESKFSEEVVAMTKVDAARIPVPRNVHFEKSTQKASFSVSDSHSLDLIAMIEVENQDGTWSLYDNLPMQSSQVK